MNTTSIQSTNVLIRRRAVLLIIHQAPEPGYSPIPISAMTLSKSSRRLLSRSLVPLPLALALLAPAGTRLLGAPERVERPIGPGVRLLRWTQDAGPNSLAAVEM